MSTAQKLYQLQEIELEIESDEKALSRCLGRLGESEAVKGVRSRIQSVRQQMTGLEKKQHSAEWQVEDIETKLTAVKETLYSGRIKNPKELASLQQEEKSLEVQRDRLEEGTLETMEQVEVVTADLAALNSELGELEDGWRSQQQELSAEIERLKKSISGLKEKQKLALVGIDTRTIDYYNQLKKQKGWAVAKIEQGTCRSCRISLSTAELQRARGEQIVECNSCRRILFLD
ncbi:zinc ribbon domain-containing protein [Chloroflexota bacterium]